MFPPGRARLATSPLPPGSPADAMTMGLLGGERRQRPKRHDHVDIEPDQLPGEIGQPVKVVLGGPLLEGDVPAFDPAELAQPVGENGPMLGRERGTRAEHSYSINFAWLLRARSERPRRRRAAEKRDELPPPHTNFPPRLRPIFSLFKNDSTPGPCGMGDNSRRLETPRSFDHLVGNREQIVGDFDAECLRGFEVDGELESGWLLDRQAARHG